MIDPFAQCPEECSQLVVVEADPAPSLSWYERAYGGWRAAGGPLPAALGRGGLAWGRGLLPDGENRDGLSPKRDGDLRTPCGLFRLGFAFGDAPALEVNPGWPYLALHDRFVLVDDSGSRFYNCVVDESLVGAPDWRSARRMRDPDALHRWGVVIEHNLFPAASGAGAGVFLHLWRRPGVATDGGTAIAEDAMLALLRFLDGAKGPLLWQGARARRG